MNIARTVDGREGAILIDASGAVVVNAGVVSSKWSATDAAVNGMTLSNGGLTVTPNQAAWKAVRGTVSKTGGKLYIEFLCNAPTDINNNIIPGIADAGFDAGNYVGTSNYSAGAFFQGTSLISSAGFVANHQPSSYTPQTNDVVQVAVDLTSGSFWLGINNTWQATGNPATGANPLISIVSPALGIAFFPVISLRNNSGVWTLQPTAASQKYAPPSGFKAWDGGPVTPPPTSVWSAADATANGMTLTNGGLTVATTAGAWKSIRGTNSKTSGKLYVEFLCNGAFASGHVMYGPASSNFNISSYLGTSIYSAGFYGEQGAVFVSSGFTTNYTPSIGFPGTNDVISIAVDFSAGSIWLGKNNSWANLGDIVGEIRSKGGNPSTGASPDVSFVPATVGALFPAISLNDTGGVTWTLQATAASQKYAPPTGFSAWDGP